MRKIAFTLIAIAAIAMVSCQKDENVNGPVFKALGESVTHSKDKTVFHTDNYTFTWKGRNPDKEVGDRIHIWDGAGHHKLYTPTSSDATVSQIVPVGSYNTLNSTPTGHFTAIYPDYYSDTTAVNVPSATTPVTVNLPSIQGITNQADQLSLLHLTRFPMYCESNNLRLEFKNLCGALRLNLQRDNTRVDRIKFTSGASDPYVCGKFSINWNNGNPLLTPCVTNNEHTVVLEYAQAVSINEATDFWLALPAGNYYNFVIEISCITSTGQRGTMSFKGNGTTALEIERSYVTPIVPNLDPEPGESGASFKGQGVFSVSDSKTVYFSPGNLQCVNNHWEFAPQQYKAAHDMISYGVNYVPAYNPDINYNWDLVGWSTTLSEYGTKHLHEDGNGHSVNTVDNYSNLPYKNWGRVFGDDTWWVLSQDEFDYVINQRVSPSNGKMHVTVNDTVNDNVRTNVRRDVSYRVIYVDGQEGCMLFPDVCSITLPSGVSFPDQDNPTHYTADQFVSVFERAGCIFLPYVGYQQNSDGQDFSLPVTLSGTYHTNGQKGRYWTSTPDPSSSNHMHAQAMNFEGSYIAPLSSQPRTCLYSVRLVTDAPATK
jgi:hypothetical protein